MHHHLNNFPALVKKAFLSTASGNFKCWKFIVSVAIKKGFSGKVLSAPEKMASNIKNMYLHTKKTFSNNKKFAPQQRGLEISLHKWWILLLEIKIYVEESQQINNFWSHLFAYIKQACKHTCAPVKPSEGQ